MATCVWTRQWIKLTIQLTHILEKYVDWSMAIAFWFIHFKKKLDYALKFSPNL